MEILQKVEQHALALLEEMGIHATIATEIKDEDPERKYILIDITGDNLGELIGYHGAILDSLQNVVSLMTSNDLREQSLGLVIDVNGYRQERIEYIQSVAKSAAMNVKENNQEVALSPMKPFERRIVHMTAKQEGLDTESRGEGMDRHVVLIPTKNS